MVIVGCTLVSEKLYTLPQWFLMVNEIKGFENNIFIAYSKHGSFWHGDRSNWQMTADRNKLRELALYYNTDLLIIDSDTFVPPETFLELSHIDADIVSGIVKNPVDYNVYVRDPDKDPTSGVPVRILPVKPNTGIIPCDAVGFGCVLLKNHILKEFEFTRDYNDIVYRRGHDQIMCLKARDKGYRVCANTNIVGLHYGRYMNDFIDEPPEDIKKQFEELSKDG